MTRRIRTFILITALSLLVVTGVQAQDGWPNPPTDNDVNAIAKQLYCPVCPNTPLDVCETQACQDWRSQIKDQLAAGWSEQKIIDYFVVQYGERVLAEPRRRGFTSFVWLLPILAVLIGGGFLWQVIRRWRLTSPEISPPARTSIAPEIVELIEQELKNFDA